MKRSFGKRPVANWTLISLHLFTAVEEGSSLSDLPSGAGGAVLHPHPPACGSESGGRPCPGFPGACGPGARTVCFPSPHLSLPPARQGQPCCRDRAASPTSGTPRPGPPLPSAAGSPGAWGARLAALLWAAGWGCELRTLGALCPHLGVRRAGPLLSHRSPQGLAGPVAPLQHSRPPTPSQEQGPSLSGRPIWVEWVSPRSLWVAAGQTDAGPGARRVGPARRQDPTLCPIPGTPGPPPPHSPCPSLPSCQCQLGSPMHPCGLCAERSWPPDGTPPQGPPLHSPLSPGTHLPTPSPLPQPAPTLDLLAWGASLCWPGDWGPSLLGQRLPHLTL